MDLKRLLYDWTRETPLYSLCYDFRQRWIYRRWLQAARPIPPPHRAKQIVIREFAAARNLQVFVETGTYYGNMVAAAKNIFSLIISIELDQHLYDKARNRFKNIPHITILQGESSSILPMVMKNITQPTLFWLDAHYSAGITAMGQSETPIMKELATVFAHGLALRHCILIDDARCFTGGNDYPSLMQVESLAKSAGYNNFAVIDDIIRISSK